MDRTPDVISVGSTMLRLSVPPGERLETAAHFEVRTAGTESNTMVALARMGFRTAWVSRLTDNPLGRRIAFDIGRHGVDVSRIIWTGEGRNELFFVEYGARPRPIKVIYDRWPSAAASMSLADLDQDYILSGRVLHLTGILAALSPDCAGLVLELLKKAGQAGVVTSFDLNYRARLWPPQRAKKVLEPMLELADLIFITQEDTVGVLGRGEGAEEAVAAIQARYKPRAVVMTLGSKGGLAFDGREFLAVKGYEVEILDRLGAGDAFSAGVLAGFLEGSLERGMEYGAAMAALKLGIKGDYFVSDRNEVEELMGAGGKREVGR